MKIFYKFLIISIVIFSLTACNFPLFSGTTEQDQVEEEIDLVGTQVAQTLQAIQQQAPTATSDLSTPTPPVDTLPVPTAQNAAVPPAAPGNQPNCLIAGTVKETIPDNTHFAPGDTFTKTWTIINSGTCEWSANYYMVFVSGDQMGGAQRC